MLYIGVDDTDTEESRGTGFLARAIAADLSTDYRVVGVLRQQLLVDPRVPCTRNNSSKAVLLDANGQPDLQALQQRVQDLMLADFVPGSDPGLCIARWVPPEVTAFGQRAKRELLTQQEARALAAAFGIALVGLGGSEDGVIGALAAVGLTAGGEDGRYILVGSARDLSGLQPVGSVLAAGIAAVETVDGAQVTDGLVASDRLRPARRRGQPILVVERAGQYWMPIKLD